jgi:GNAT superfamily N-acetyltransferase
VARTSKRPAYAGVVEHSVYVHPAARGRGVGLALLAALIPLPKMQVSGPCGPAFFPRTPPASPCTGAPGSASLAPATVPAAFTAGTVGIATRSTADIRPPARAKPAPGAADFSQGH